MRKRKRKGGGKAKGAGGCPSPVLCEDPSTGKLTLRWSGRCNASERARVIAKIATDGIDVSTRDAEAAAADE